MNVNKQKNSADNEKIKVYLLNFHSLASHIELVLEKKTNGFKTYYGINRWERPENSFVRGYLWDENTSLTQRIKDADSTVVFEIEASANEIISEWKKYFKETSVKASIADFNCAEAAQWFLSKFAGIPRPNSSNTSINHLALGIFWPSIVPSPILLPGRVMSNAKFYINEEKLDNKKTPPISTQNYIEKLSFSMHISLAILIIGTSVFALGAALAILANAITKLYNAMTSESIEKSGDTQFGMSQ